jgi:hypothetical protein
MKVEELLALISALPTNTTLLGFNYCRRAYFFTVDEVNQLVSILMKTGWSVSCRMLVRTMEQSRHFEAEQQRDAGISIKDGSLSSKGVDVLSAVSDEIDCVFCTCLENPTVTEGPPSTTGR